MKIVVLDAQALNPGDLDWTELKKLGETVIYDRSSEDETPGRIAGADIVLTNKSILNEEIIRNAPDLKYIGVMATGFNIVDIEAAKKRNIVVTNVPAYSTASVAQLVFSFILELANHTMLYSDSVRKGDWAKSIDFSYQLKPTTELHNKTLGIIGFGQIGQAVAKIALAFGMNVISSHKHPERDKMPGVHFTDEETCFATSDFITLHCPLNEQNKEFVNEKLLSKMKPTACLINTSRGGLINEQELADALNSGKIAGAGLDVLSTEPPFLENLLLDAKNCLITPHIAWATVEARTRLMNTLVDNINAFTNGEPRNVVG
ncbi:MAG: D-2-hydroxyacid dehydrogenase [Ginsengibacter sp.]